MSLPDSLLQGGPKNNDERMITDMSFSSQKLTIADEGGLGASFLLNGKSVFYSRIQRIGGQANADDC